MFQNARFIPDFMLDIGQFCFEWGMFLCLFLMIASFVLISSMGLFAFVRHIYYEVFPFGLRGWQRGKDL